MSPTWTKYLILEDNYSVSRSIADNINTYEQSWTSQSTAHSYCIVIPKQQYVILSHGGPGRKNNLPTSWTVLSATATNSAKSFTTVWCYLEIYKKNFWRIFGQRFIYHHSVSVQYSAQIIFHFRFSGYFLFWFLDYFFSFFVCLLILLFW